MPEPLAQGDLHKTPLAHVIVSITQKRLSGTLVVWPDPAPAPAPEGQDRVLFRDGHPVAARLIHASSRLDMGVLGIFGRQGAAPYAFYAEDLVGEGQGVVTGQIDSFAIVAASLRGKVREDVIEGVLRTLGKDRLRIRRGLDLGRYMLQRKEKAFVEVLQAEPATQFELMHTYQDRVTARRVLYLLAITQAVESYQSLAPRAAPVSERLSAADPELPPPPRVPAEAAPRPRPASMRGEPVEARPRPASMRGEPVSPGGSEPVRPRHRPRSIAPTAEEAPPCPPSLVGELAERWERIADRVRRIDKEDYFEMLGVARDASPKDVESAYLKLVKTWHPDRVPVELVEIRPWADRIFHHLTMAKDTLVDLDERGKYIKSVDAGGGTPEADRKVAAVVTAALEFDKIEVIARRRQWDEALAALEEIMAIDDSQATYHSMLGYLLLQKSGGEGDELRILEALNVALEIDPSDERALFTKGMMLKKQGKKGDALRLFKKVVEQNPKHVEAQREVRVATMRGMKPSAGPGEDEPDTESGGGLLSKLFGGKKK